MTKKQILEYKLRKIIREEMLKEENIYDLTYGNLEQVAAILGKTIRLLLQNKSPEADALRKEISPLRDKIEYILLGIQGK